ncbi:unnamed protein product [Trichobilharzia szidati]|nr:unnamed protein product [Trichobilharzia szidati]
MATIKDKRLVNVFCQRHLLEICLSPISQPPYQNLAENLHLRRSIAFVTNLTLHQNFIDTCRLDVKRNSLQGKQWNHTTVNPVRAEQHQVLCKTIDWRQDPTRTPCGISITEYMSGHLYTGYLAVITSQEHRNQESDLLFQFTCKTNNDVPHRVPGQVFERNLDTDKEDLFKDSSWPKLDVKLSIKDENGQSVQTILESTAVKFEAELIDELNIYKAVIVEECYMIDELESGQRNADSKETLLLYKGCPMLKSESTGKSTISFNFQTNHYGNEQALIFRSTDNLHHIQTGLFRLYPNYSSTLVDGRTSRTSTTGSNYTFTHDRTMKLTFEQMNSIDETFKQKLSEIGHRLHELKFTCIFRVCKQLAWCSWPSACDSTLTSLNNPRITFLPPGLRIIQRSVPLYLIESVPSSHLPVKKQAKSKVCEELFCSNTLHIVLMMGLVGILTCLMGVMGMLLARKYRHRLHQTRSTFLRSKTKLKQSNHSSAPPAPPPGSGAAGAGAGGGGAPHHHGRHHHHDQHCLQCSETNTQSLISSSSLLSKSYYNPIIQSTITQHLLHYKQQTEQQQSENGALKSLLTVDNNIDTNINSSSNNSSKYNNNNSDISNINPSCTIGMKDCCKYWLNEHSYANPLLIKNSSNDLSQYHPHACHQLQHGQQTHTAIQPQQHHQQHQLSSSSSGATPSHCSCLSDIVFNDRTKKNAQNSHNSHNYYTFKRYTTLPTTTLTPLNTTTSFMKADNESGLINNRTTTFLLEPMNPLIHTNAITTNNISGNFHDTLTTPYPTTFINHNNNSSNNDDNSKNTMFFCPDQLSNRHDASLYQHHKQQQQLYSQADRYGVLDSAVGGNDESLKNVNFVYNTNNSNNSSSNDNKPEISLQEYKKLTSPSNDTVYFGVDFPNSSYTINPLDLTLCTDSLQKLQAQTQSQILQPILGQAQPQQTTSATTPATIPTVCRRLNSLR